MYILPPEKKNNERLTHISNSGNGRRVYRSNEMIGCRFIFIAWANCEPILNSKRLMPTGPYNCLIETNRLKQYGIT